MSKEDMFTFIVIGKLSVEVSYIALVVLSTLSFALKWNSTIQFVVFILTSFITILRICAMMTECKKRLMEEK